MNTYLQYAKKHPITITRPRPSGGLDFSMYSHVHAAVGLPTSLFLISCRCCLKPILLNSNLKKLFSMAATNHPELIAFYLPQFHPIEENDIWWGRGFTEWTNLTKSQSLFAGHIQPRLPADLGFYDLRLPETREAQADLARRAGISAFCYYYYWFGGRRLLERPLNEVIALGRPDFPFCICWANESWTRRWDGLDKEVLIAQDYANVDPESFIRDLLPALHDSRYFRINGKALLLVYRPESVPEMKRWTDIWRAYAHANGAGELMLCCVHSFSQDPPESQGFDAAVEFPPLGGLLDRSLLTPSEVAVLIGTESNFQGLIANYPRFARWRPKPLNLLFAAFGAWLHPGTTLLAGKIER